MALIEREVRSFWLFHLRRFVSRFVVDVTLDSGVAHASIRARRCDTLHPVSARALHTVEFHVGRLAEARTAAPSHQAWLRYLGWP